MRESKRYRVRNVRIYHTIRVRCSDMRNGAHSRVDLCLDTIRSLSDLVVVMYACARICRRHCVSALYHNKSTRESAPLRISTANATVEVQWSMAHYGHVDTITFAFPHK